MSKNKLQRFADNLEYKHVFEPAYKSIDSDSFELKNKWSSFFKNDNPITLELACGKGEYTVGLAEMYPDRNFIGIDLKGARIWVGATYAKDNGLNNVAFIRTRVDFIHALFGQNEISEIWITFPDPQNKKRRKRLTYPRFLKLYSEILKPNSSLNLKTDSDKLYYYTKSVAEQNQLKVSISSNDIYNSDALNEELKIETFYESLFKSKGDNINFISFKLDKDDYSDSDFDEDKYDDAFAEIPYDYKVSPSKLTQ